MQEVLNTMNTPYEFELGDYVLVKKGLITGNTYDGIVLLDSMNYPDKVFKIARRLWDRKWEIGEKGFIYSEDMIEPYIPSKAGEKIKIRDDLVVNCWYGENVFVKKMKGYLGKELTVTSFCDNIDYTVKEACYSFTPEMTVPQDNNRPTANTFTSDSWDAMRYSIYSTHTATFSTTKDKNMKYSGYFKDKDIYIKKVIYNPPCTIVFWSDDTKTTSKCDEHDAFDRTSGLALAILKKFTSPAEVARIFEDWVPAGKAKDYAKVELKDLRKKSKKVSK